VREEGEFVNGFSKIRLSPLFFFLPPLLRKLCVRKIGKRRTTPIPSSSSSPPFLPLPSPLPRYLSFKRRSPRKNVALSFFFFSPPFPFHLKEGELKEEGNRLPPPFSLTHGVVNGKDKTHSRPFPLFPLLPFRNFWVGVWKEVRLCSSVLFPALFLFFFSPLTHGKIEMRKLVSVLWRSRYPLFFSFFLLPCSQGGQE